MEKIKECVQFFLYFHFFFFTVLQVLNIQIKMNFSALLGQVDESQYVGPNFTKSDRGHVEESM